MTSTVIVTGASGVLGSAVLKAFQADSKYKVIGTAHSRPSSELETVDLTDPRQAEALITKHKPELVIHCAAERRPDVAAKDPEATRKLNGTVPLTLAQLSASAEHPFTLVYISTDYVFDGTAAPYEVDAKPNPVQLYGETKLAGEEAIRSVESSHGRRISLRVPVLYGPVRENSDSAVNILLDVVRDQSGKTYKMDHYATRYPTNVVDIGAFLVRLANKYPGGSGSLPPTLHYSAPEPYTKYEMCLVLAALSSPPLAHEHIIPDADEPVIPPGGVGRPKDCRLSTRVVEEELGLEIGAQGFREWWAAELGRV